MPMVDLEGTEGYIPSTEYVEDSNETLINLTDSTELLFLKLPSSNVSLSLCIWFGYFFWTESQLHEKKKYKGLISLSSSSSQKWKKNQVWYQAKLKMKISSCLGIPFRCWLQSRHHTVKLLFHLASTTKHIFSCVTFCLGVKNCHKHFMLVFLVLDIINECG